MENDFFELKSNNRQITRIVEEKYGTECIVIKRAYIFALGLLMQPVVIDETNQIATNKVHINIMDSQCAEQLDREIHYMAEKYPDKDSIFKDVHTAKEIGLLQRWAGGHTSASIELLFKEGYQNRIDEAFKLMQTMSSKKKKDFLKAELIVLLAAQKQIIRYSKEAEKLYNNSSDEYSKQKYLRMVEACRNIAYKQPQNLFEGVQLIAITHEFCIVENNGASSQGLRIDQLLNKFYLSDIKNGIINRDGALDLVCSLWEIFESFGERTSNLTIGGCDQYGNDCSNEMTIICMEASIKIKADVPLLTLRVHPKLNDKVWDKALELVKSGQGFPAFYNDNVAVKAKMNAGVSLEDAYDYSTLGCVEITIGGREFSNTEGARINWLKLLELLLFDGKCILSGKEWRLEQKHNVEEFLTFNELYEWFKDELKSTIKRVGEFIDMASDVYSQHWPTPYLSSITMGCIENASDITEDGTKYYNLSINCVGMANTVDALEAIEELVYIRKITTIGEIKKALKLNFTGYEWLRQEMLNCSKYGNDIETVDNKMRDLMMTFSSCVNSMKIINKRGKFQCGFYSVMHHALLGMKTAASCDGRYAKTALSNSLSPVQGMDKKGPTAVMNSVNRVSMEYMGNGGVLDLKFTPQFLEKQNHTKALKYLIQTYFEEGGLEVQFNVVSKYTLVKAQKEPEKYGNLVVRVSGYSAYFVKLDRQVQDEIIMRTENNTV